MANKITDTRYYSAIAEAIRTKGRTSNTYTPPQMAQAILELPTSGGGMDFVFGEEPIQFVAEACEQYNIVTARVVDLVNRDVTFASGGMVPV